MRPSRAPHDRGDPLGYSLTAWIKGDGAAEARARLVLEDPARTTPIPCASLTVSHAIGWTKIGCHMTPKGGAAFRTARVSIVNETNGASFLVDQFDFRRVRHVPSVRNLDMEELLVGWMGAGDAGSPPVMSWWGAAGFASPGAMAFSSVDDKSSRISQDTRVVAKVGERFKVSVVARAPTADTCVALSASSVAGTSVSPIAALAPSLLPGDGSWATKVVQGQATAAGTVRIELVNCSTNKQALQVDGLTLERMP